MNKKLKKKILKKYLGAFPSWFDLRKKEILKDNIDIIQWQNNMNYLIIEHGTIERSEQKAFKKWLSLNLKYIIDKGEMNYISENKYNNIEELFKSDIEEYLEGKVTPVLTNIWEESLPPILRKGQGRNWFLAGYPDVFDYFFPDVNLNRDNKDVDNLIVNTKVDFERMGKYIATGKGNQTIYLIRMKNFYRYELNRKFLLCKE